MDELGLKAVQRTEEDRARRLALAEVYRPVAAAAVGVEDPFRYPLVVLPGINPRMTDLPAERRDKFTRYLREMIDAADGPPDEPDTEPPEIPELAAKMLGETCALCKGWCCNFGGERAFMSSSTIRRYRAAHPEKTVEEIEADYLARLTGPTVEGSCVYHQSTGCGLPRDMRSWVCNHHLCRDQKNFLSMMKDLGELRAFFVAFPEGVVGPAAFADGSETRPCPEPVAAG